MSPARIAARMVDEAMARAKRLGATIEDCDELNRAIVALDAAVDAMPMGRAIRDLQNGEPCRFCGDRAAVMVATDFSTPPKYVASCKECGEDESEGYAYIDAEGQCR